MNVIYLKYIPYIPQIRVSWIYYNVQSSESLMNVHFVMLDWLIYSSHHKSSRTAFIVVTVNHVAWDGVRMEVQSSWSVHLAFGLTHDISQKNIGFTQKNRGSFQYQCHYNSIALLFRLWQFHADPLSFRLHDWILSQMVFFRNLCNFLPLASIKCVHWWHLSSVSHRHWFRLMQSNAKTVRSSWKILLEM